MTDPVMRWIKFFSVHLCVENVRVDSVHMNSLSRKMSAYETSHDGYDTD